MTPRLWNPTTMLLMIIRVIAVLSSIGLLFCLALSGIPAGAAIGHTIRNGGGDGELEFIEIWETLARTLTRCVHPDSPCRLSSGEREQLRSLIQLRTKMNRPPSIDTALLYNAAGEPKDSVEILAVAIEALQNQSCEQLATHKLDSSKLAADLISIQFFKVFSMPAGDFVVKSVGNQITIAKGEKSVNLTSLIEPRLGAPIIKIGYLASDFKRGKIEVRGRINGAEVICVIDASLDPKTVFLFLQ